MSIRALSAELQRKAEEELNENPARIQEDLKHVRDWLEKQPHLTVRSDEQFCLGFLRGSKFSLEQTKEKLDNFHTMRSLLPEFFTNRDPLSPEIQEILKANVIMPLPSYGDGAGPRILLFRWKHCDPKTMSVTNLIKVFCMTMDVLMNEYDDCVVAGLLFFVDYIEYDFNYMLQLNPIIAKKFALCAQGMYPIRVKGLQCIYTPSLIEVLYKVVKPFVPEKIKNRVHFYGETNSNEVFKVLPKAPLPKEYGGDGGLADNLAAAWREKLESYREWFLQDENYRSDENLRPEKPKTSADVFGTEGSFRKLNID